MNISKSICTKFQISSFTPSYQTRKLIELPTYMTKKKIVHEKCFPYQGNVLRWHRWFHTERFLYLLFFWYGKLSLWNIKKVKNRLNHFEALHFVCQLNTVIFICYCYNKKHKHLQKLSENNGMQSAELFIAITWLDSFISEFPF